MEVGGEGMRLVRRMRAGKGVGSIRGCWEEEEGEGGDDSGDGVRRCRVELASADSIGGGSGGALAGRGDVVRVARVGAVAAAAAAAVAAFSAASACERVTSNSSLTSVREKGASSGPYHPCSITAGTHLALRPLIAGLLPRAGLSRRALLRGGRSARAPCCTASRGSAAKSPFPCVRA
jgi:hypothetical protein